jgi:hypothetical protein
MIIFSGMLHRQQGHLVVFFYVIHGEKVYEFTVVDIGTCIHDQVGKTSKARGIFGPERNQLVGPVWMVEKLYRRPLKNAKDILRTIRGATKTFLSAKAQEFLAELKTKCRL